MQRKEEEEGGETLTLSLRVRGKGEPMKVRREGMLLFVRYLH